MSGSVLVYMLPMMLGQTYDMGTDTPGIQIFNDSTATQSKKIEHFFTDSQYRMVENSKDVRDFLDVKGKMSLKIKAGAVDVSGEGSYLKDSSMKTNAIEIIVKVHFESVTRTIPSSWKPNMDWRQHDQKSLGTHYCRSITYGGDLIASVTFTTSNAFNKERIKGALRAGLNVGGVTAGLQGQLEILKNEVEDDSSMEIKYYATVPIPGVSYTIEGLMNEVKDFPNHVKNVNNGLGNPLQMELYPLSSLDSTFSTYVENRALNDQLEDLEDQFDDIRTARKETMSWITNLPPDVPQTVQNKINDFLDRIENVYGAYSESIFNLDLSVHASTKPFEAAFEAYRNGSYMIPDKYNRELKRLQKDIYEEFPELKPKYGGATYIRWGRSSCGSADEVKTEVSGVAIATKPSTIGGSSEFKCSPTKPQLLNPEDHFKDYKSDADKGNQLLINPISYSGTLQQFTSMVKKRISCSVCRVKQRASTVTSHAVTACPEGWTKEYQGLLMAPESSGFKGDYICVDENMGESEESSFGHVTGDGALIQEVTISCGSLPCGPYQTNSPISCVVCTR